MANDFTFYVGIDWATENHRVCLMTSGGETVNQRWAQHSGSGLEDLVQWLRKECNAAPATIAVAIEVPRGAVVETLMEHGFAVFSVNPKQLDRFRDRHSVAGAKDDRRDAFVLADSLRTDLRCFHPVRLDDPLTIRLRELSRLEDDIQREQTRLRNQLREQWHRFFPQMLLLCPAADEVWAWELFEAAPLPAKAARLRGKRVDSILRRHRIRRLGAADVIRVFSTRPLSLAPGAEEAASEHALLLLPRLRLLEQQRTQIAARIDGLLEEMSAPADDQPAKHRDAQVLLSLPGVGRRVGAAMLSEASQALADRDYHALRCYAGVAPVTRQSGKKLTVIMRKGCNERLRNAFYHWSRVSVVCDPRSRHHYHQLRSRGHSHGRALRGVADRWISVLISMLNRGTLYDPALRTA